MTAFLLRPGRPSDYAYVVDTWLTSHAHSGIGREMLRGGIYWSDYKPIVRALLGTQRLTVACDPKDDDAILGWACTSGAPPGELDPRVYYVYVRGGGRRCGIARALLADFLAHPCTFTHLPPHGKLPIPEAWQFDPERNTR